MAKSACDICDLNTSSSLQKLGVSNLKQDFVIALAGNPNTGKSTVFNALTGLKQHTGNWPGKTVTSQSGSFKYSEDLYTIVDLPGTYSLLSTSEDEQVARDFILFDQPDVTVVVVDAGRLERHLSLAVQIMDITSRVVICVNLMDEAQRHGITIDLRGLSKDLGVPVVATSARSKKGIPELLMAISKVAHQQDNSPKSTAVKNLTASSRLLIQGISKSLLSIDPQLPNASWIAMRLVQKDSSIENALLTGKLSPNIKQENLEPILLNAEQVSLELGKNYARDLAQGIFDYVSKIVKNRVDSKNNPRAFKIDRAIDNIVTSKTFGFPIMLLLLGAILWLTIIGSNYPSSALSYLLLDQVYPLLKQGALYIHMPWWLSGFLIDGVYLATAWVIAVMLPPMAIFFPLFTLLEDFGYLPRVAFNLDRVFKAAGAHGKQALTMSMGFGCNAAGVVSTRIINSPREKLIAIITNNFSLCNGRWPTQILIATIFVGALVPTYMAGFISTLAVVFIVVLGIGFTFFSSWLLSKTLLKGESSFFTLELPPYRPPQFFQTLYTSLIDRTLIVLGRAVVFAAPAGALIWLVSNISVSQENLALLIIDGLNPVAVLIGLNGVILLAYIIAIPANEIVIPTILMLTAMVLKDPTIGQGAGVLFELGDSQIADILLQAGWTTLTGINLMLFSLLHNPCSTTIYTIYKETNSFKWTFVATVLPIVFGILVCLLTTQIYNFFVG
ncbi:ferrous iron transport protein B [Myroides sp. LJL119]